MLYERSARVLGTRIKLELERLGFKVYPVSTRDGFYMLMVERSQKRLLVWIRTSPITERALRLFERMASKYVKDAVLVLKFYERADYVPTQLSSRRVSSGEEAVGCIAELF